MTRRIYPLGLIRYSYCYDIEEICALYKAYNLHPQTVRGWIKNGLPTIDQGKPCLIYGGALKSFLGALNQPHKCKTAFDEMFCFKCRDAEKPYKKQIQLKQERGYVRAKARCQTCKSSMNKSYAISDIPRIRSIFKVVDALELYDSADPTDNTHIATLAASQVSERLQGETISPMKPDPKYNFHPGNERAKYKYRIHIRRALGKDEKTVIAVLRHIRDFEIYCDFAGFDKFNETIAHKYIEHLFSRELSISYIEHDVRYLKEFLKWLERQKGYRNRIHYNHIEYLNISSNQRRIAKASAYKKSYTYEQIIAVIHRMPNASVIEKRNKAVVSLQTLCSLRTSELRTVKLKNLICEEDNYFIHVNPKDMEVKFAKMRHANFIRLPKDILQNVLIWREYLMRQGFKAHDSLFPQIDSKFSQSNLLENNVSHKEIKANSTIRQIFRMAFESAGHEYLHPHSFRRTLAKLGEKGSPEFMNAIRQSLGHSNIDVTMHSYGSLSEHEQRNRISNTVFDFSEESEYGVNSKKKLPIREHAHLALVHVKEGL